MNQYYIVKPKLKKDIGNPKLKALESYLSRNLKAISESSVIFVKASDVFSFYKQHKFSEKLFISLCRGIISPVKLLISIGKIPALDLQAKQEAEERKSCPAIERAEKVFGVKSTTRNYEVPKNARVWTEDKDGNIKILLKKQI